ncbi:MAG: RdgB/HAM1 family non-canonical purine NTP pyrophosphatase [Bryobacteraceae bacterium]
MIVYAGTSNLGKLREFKLGAPDFDIRAVELPPPEEHGETFEETARQKALYYGAHLQDYVFADDSGLEVDALGGGPGVHSARFAGPQANDAANNALLLERMRGISNRTARFVCVIALVRSGKVERTFRGSVEGRIIDPSRGEKPRGANGFGYDPLFFHEPFGCTFGEAASEQKMRVSHRGQALEAMFTYLRGIAST